MIAPAFSGDMLGGGATSATEPGVAAAVEGLAPSSFAPGGLLQVTPREEMGKRCHIPAYRRDLIKEEFYSGKEVAIYLLI